MKLAYNRTLSGMAVGEQDVMFPCPLGGSAHISGVATSNDLEGSTRVELTYDLSQCSFLQVASAPEENYRMTVEGSIAQSGTLAVQPSSTTALVLTSDVISLDGTVYDPALDYHVDACVLKLAQNGNNLSGTICERVAGVEL